MFSSRTLPLGFDAHTHLPGPQQAYQEAFHTMFASHYETIHRYETNKLRNLAKLYAHLLYTDALPWTVFGYVRLSEGTTTSSSRIFLKFIFQELCTNMGLQRLKK